MRVPWTARRSNQFILKEISPGISLEGMMLKLKLQYFGHLTQRGLIGEDSDAGRDWGQEEKGTTEDEMAGWHHGLDGRESESTPGVGERLNIVKQIDFGSGGRYSRKSVGGGGALRPHLCVLSGLLPHDFCHGWDSPYWLLAP